MKLLNKLFIIISASFVCLNMLSACEEEIQRPDVIEPLMPDKGPEGTGGSIGSAEITQTVVFQAGAGQEVFRIPSVVTAKDGSVIVFAEDRHRSWRDKSYTDVVCKRSTDNGVTWSAAVSITGQLNQGGFAFMDPTPVVDKETGKIFLFCTRWNELDTNPQNNKAFMSVSSDNGVTWSTPQDVSSQIIVPGMYSTGFGPGHGIQIATGKKAGRLVVITRQAPAGENAKNSGYAIYSDDHGQTWTYGAATVGAEAQIAESGVDRLYMNVRKGGDRAAATSLDGGHSWNTALVDASLPFVEGGCEASVLGVGDNMVFYCGPESGPTISGHDNRYNLKLFRSAVGGSSWSRSQVIYDKAAGYSDMTLLSDGKLAIIFEAGSEQGFIKATNRPAGWMRLDFLVLPADITDYDYWL